MYNCSLVIAHGDLKMVFNWKINQIHAKKKFFIDDAAEWGVIEDNYTGNGVVGEVALRQADVGISALYLW